MATSAKRQAWLKIKEKVSRHFKKREELSKKAKQGDWEAGIKLQKQSPDRSRVRHRNRCNNCGRPHGTNRKTGLCRLCLRKFLNEGKIPGWKKSSW